MPEQASEQDGLAGYQPGPSTFPGGRTRGGWIPIMARAEDWQRPFRIDWLCPSCKQLTGNYRTCPKCGLEVLTSPKIKQPLPKRKKHYIYRKWAWELFDDEDDNISLSRRARRRKNHSSAAFPQARKSDKPF